MKIILLIITSWVGCLGAGLATGSWTPTVYVAPAVVLLTGYTFGRPAIDSYMRHERSLRHIADMEIELGLDDVPWHYKRVVFHDSYGCDDGFGYIRADDRDLDATLFDW